MSGFLHLASGDSAVDAVRAALVRLDRKEEVLPLGGALNIGPLTDIDAGAASCLAWWARVLGRRLDAEEAAHLEGAAVWERIVADARPVVVWHGPHPHERLYALRACWRLRDQAARIHEVRLDARPPRPHGWVPPTFFGAVGLRGPVLLADAWPACGRVSDAAARAKEWERIRARAGEWFRELDGDAIVDLPVDAYDVALDRRAAAARTRDLADRCDRSSGAYDSLMRECLPLAAAALVVAAGACGARTPLYGGGSESAPSVDASSSGGSSSGFTGSSGSSSGAPEAGAPEAAAPGCPAIPPAGGGSGGGAPVVFANVPQAYGLAADSTNLYVASAQEGPVSVVPLGGGPVVTLDAIGQYAVALNATGVYTIASGKGIVAACPKTGCGGKYTTLATGQFDVGDVAADDRYVYWTNEGIVDGQFPGVMRVPVSGGAPVALLPGDDTEQIVAVDDRVFFVSNEGRELCALSPDGSLSQRQPPPLGRSAASALAADCTNVYLATADGSVSLIPVDGGSPTILATSTASPPEPATQIAVDAASVYFIRSETYAGPAASGTGTLQSVPIAGGPVTTLATMSYAPNGIAVDADSVYWTDTAAGTVMRIAK